jgi:hypothetical protein
MQTTATRRQLLLFLSSFLAVFSRFSKGQNPAQASETPSVLNMHMDWTEHDFFPATEAMPEDKFFWAPKIGEFQGGAQFCGANPARGGSQYCSFCSDPR